MWKSVMTTVSTFACLTLATIPLAAVVDQKVSGPFLRCVFCVDSTFIYESSAVQVRHCKILVEHRNEKNVFK